MQDLEFAEEQFNRKLLATIIGPIISLVLGAAIGYAYAYVVDINPFIYVGFIAALFVGGALGVGVLIILGMFGSSDRFTRIIATGAAVAACLWMYYAQWLNLHDVRFWSITPILEWHTLGLMEPFRVAFEEIAPYVSYSVSRNGGSNGLGTGGAQWFWYLEIALIVLPAAMIAVFAGGDFVNRATGGTMNSFGGTHMLAHLSQADVDNNRAAMQARDFTLFQPMSEEDTARIATNKDAKKKDHVAAAMMELFRDSKDAGCYSIRIKTGGYTYDNKEGWETSFNDGTVVDHLLINQSEYDAIVGRMA